MIKLLLFFAGLWVGRYALENEMPLSIKIVELVLAFLMIMRAVYKEQQ